MARSRTVRRGGFSGFYAIVIVIVVVGTALVLFSRKANNAGAVGPYLKGADNHWHAALAANICGTWQPGPIWPSTTDAGGPARKGTNTFAGLHTDALQDGQSSGLVHMEPQAVEESGKFATVGLWMKYGGWKATDTSLSLWNGADNKPIKVKNGDTCPSGPYKGKKGTVFWALGRNQAGKTTKLVVQDGKSLSKYKLFDQDVIGVYFLPSGTKLTGDLAKVPSEANLADPAAGETSSPTNVGSTTVPKPGSTTTTKPGTTTTKPGSTTTAAKSSSSTTTTSASTTLPTSTSPGTSTPSTTAPSKAP